MSNIDVLGAARLEFREARAWYRAENSIAARHFALEIKKAIATIREHPEQQLRWDETYRFRILDRFPYYVAFRQTADSVIGVAIRHSAQDQDAWLGR